MPHPDLGVVTGAFSYTGRYVTRRTLDQGVRVSNLTRSPDAEDPFGGRVEVAPPGLLRPRWTVPVNAGSGRLLQHLLDSVRPWPDHLRPRGREHQDAVRGCQEGWRRPDGPLLGDKPFLGVRPPLFQRQVLGGGYAEGPRSPLRYHQADLSLRRR